MKNALEGLSTMQSSSGVLFVKTLTGKTFEIETSMQITIEEWRVSSRIRRAFLRTSRGSSSLEDNCKMDALSVITTSKLNPPSTWYCDSEVEDGHCASSSLMVERWALMDLGKACLSCPSTISSKRNTHISQRIVSSCEIRIPSSIPLPLLERLASTIKIVRSMPSSLNTSSAVRVWSNSWKLQATGSMISRCSKISSFSNNTRKGCCSTARMRGRPWLLSSLST